MNIHIYWVKYIVKKRLYIYILFVFLYTTFSFNQHFESTRLCKCRRFTKYSIEKYLYTSYKQI